MSKFFQKPYDVELYLPKNDREEFGPGAKDIQVCKSCQAVYYFKSWHHSDAPLPGIKRHIRQFKLTTCPACHMIAQHLYEGEVRIKGVPSQVGRELRRLIRSFGARASSRDCQHRIINVFTRPQNWVVTTTENQLAVRLAKKIRDAFKKVGVRIAHSHSPDDVGRAVVSFNQ